MTAVEIRNLTKKFNQLVACDNLNLKIEKGEIIGIIGPDGAGKTTFLRLLAGLLKPSSGSIMLEGIEVAKNPQKIKEFIGYMPQHFSLYGDLNVSENLKFFADLYGVPSDKFKERKKELLRFSGLSPFEDRLARNLSGGMQKKLVLACNLFHTPDILLLDEPTTGVDPLSRKELWDLLFQINSRGTTLLITTPYMDEAQRCHKISFMYEGRILSYNSPQSLIEERKEETIELIAEHRGVRRLLGKLPGLKSIYPFGETLHLIFESGIGAEKITKEFLKKERIQIHSLKRITPSFEDAFLALIEEQVMERTQKKFS
ncbi:MAG: ATP-binding cassette domain-containing protein [Candidatus Aminicenantes bacterium]|nr:ATP-binding cassette domain-containing protein [Candidatus Aminicenantes bacterium]